MLDQSQVVTHSVASVTLTLSVAAAGLRTRLTAYQSRLGHGIHGQWLHGVEGREAAVVDDGASLHAYCTGVDEVLRKFQQSHKHGAARRSASDKLYLDICPGTTLRVRSE